MGRPASGNQNSATLCSKAAWSFRKLFVHGAEKMTVILLTAWVSNLSVLFTMNQELD